MAARSSIVVESALETTGYLATNEQLAVLAQEYATGLGAIGGVRVSFLRILVAHAKHDAGRQLKKLTPVQARKQVQATYDRLYAVVLAAIATPELVADEKLSPRENTRRSLERNRRSNFARTAKHALDTFLDCGGKLWAVPVNVTKEELRRIARPDDRGGTRGLVRSATRTAERAVKVLTQLAETNKAAARKLLSSLIEQLEPLQAATAKPLTRKTVRRGDLTLHPEQRASH